MNNYDFIVLDAELQSDYKQWIEIWKSWPDREVFAYPDYVSLYKEPSCRAMVAILQGINFYVLFPFLIRDLAVEEYCGTNLPQAKDIITPYGYGGAFVWGKCDRDAVAEIFWKKWERWALSNGVVCEFLRLSLFKEMLLPYPGKCEEKLINVVRTLNHSNDTLWMSFKNKVRKNVKRAKREGIKIEIDFTGKNLDEFLNIYKQTMNRRDAKKTYYFPKKYFENIIEKLPGQFAFFYALWGKRIVSTELLLISASTIYSFLGGTLSEAFHVRPNDLLKYHIIIWGKENGKSRYVLGGGYQPDDGIFRYKLAFAPNGGSPFLVGCKILIPQLYYDLIEERKRYEKIKGIAWEPQEGFFPAYRS